MQRFLTLFRPVVRWFVRRGPCAHLHFTLYTRQGCHLCEDAERLLRDEQQRAGFALTLVDVDTDLELMARHGNCVPVVAVNDKVRFRGRVNPVLLTRLLRAEAARSARRVRE